MTEHLHVDLALVGDEGQQTRDAAFADVGGEDAMQAVEAGRGERRGTG